MNIEKISGISDIDELKENLFFLVGEFDQKERNYKEVVHGLSEEEGQCGCGCLKDRIGQEISEQLDYIPAKVRVIRNIRYKYACKNCEGTEDDTPAVSIARMPDQIIPKSIATPGLLAHILTAKFADALPFYRQEKQFKRLGVEIPRSTMCGWAMKTAEACDIILAMMKKAVLQSDLINIDETPVQVLKEPGRLKSYMWVFKGTSRGRPVLLYHYDPSRSGDVAASFLNGYKGIVQTDGYSGYGFLDQKKDILHVGCWVHARRKFVEVTKAVSRKTQTPVGYIRKGENLGDSGFCMSGFKEKPDAARAQTYLNSGDYLWNSGMFMFRAQKHIEALERFQPDIIKTCRTAMENGSPDMNFIRVDKKIFLTCPDDSIDYAVMEKEVQSGSYLGEDDIVRLEDRYGRVE